MYFQKSGRNSENLEIKSQLPVTTLFEALSVARLMVSISFAGCIPRRFCVAQQFSCSYVLRYFCVVRELSCSCVQILSSIKTNCFLNFPEFSLFCSVWFLIACFSYCLQGHIRNSGAISCKGVGGE